MTISLLSTFYIVYINFVASPSEARPIVKYFDATCCSWLADTAVDVIASGIMTQRASLTMLLKAPDRPIAAP